MSWVSRSTSDRPRSRATASTTSACPNSEYARSGLSDRPYPGRSTNTTRRSAASRPTTGAKSIDDVGKPCTTSNGGAPPGRSGATSTRATCSPSTAIRSARPAQPSTSSITSSPMGPSRPAGAGAYDRPPPAASRPTPTPRHPPTTRRTTWEGSCGAGRRTSRSTGWSRTPTGPTAAPTRVGPCVYPGMPARCDTRSLRGRRRWTSSIQGDEDCRALEFRLRHVGREPRVERDEVPPVAEQGGDEHGVGGQCRGELGVDVQGAVTQESLAVVFDGETSRRPGQRLASDLVTGVIEPGDDGHQPTAGARVVDRGPVAGEACRVEAVSAGADGDGAWCDAEEQPRQRRAALPLPEPEVEVVLVGRPVLAEADVSVDPEDRPVDPRLGGDAGDEVRQARADGLDEPDGRVEVAGPVAIPVGLEPRLGVVGAEVGQEVERLGRKREAG